MEKVRTRSQRHIKKQRNVKFNRRNVLPLVGATLVVSPAVFALAPQATYATQHSTSSTASFIDQVGGIAQQVADQYDLYASVMLAQAILESANGTSVLGSAPYYNLFGVKGYGQPDAVWLQTQEFLNGEWHVMSEPFRRYNSYWESFVDHAELLKSTNPYTGNAYYQGAWKGQTSSYADATAHLTGRYATDPTYNQKLNGIIAAYNLTRFDTPAQSSAPQAAAVQQTTAVATSAATTTQQTYTVQSGDTLWAIASNYGVSVDALMATNGLSSDLVVVGQQLTV